MDDETGIWIETEIWIECDRCGKAFGGPGVFEAMRVSGCKILCARCWSALSAARLACPHGVT